MTTYYIEVSPDAGTVSDPVLYRNLEQVYGDNISDEVLLKHGYHPIAENEPTVTDNQYVNRLGYALQGGNTYAWVYEIITSDNEHMRNVHIRTARRALLSGSDWTQVADAPLTTEEKNAWAEYRQALRDLTTTYTEVVNASDIVWPVPPNAPQTATAE